METPLSRLEDLEAEFELSGSWTERYRVIVEMGRDLPSMPPEQKNETNFISGCVSPVWLSARLENSLVYYQGASDGVLPQGLVALTIRLFDALPAAVIAAFSCDVDARLGLDKNLTPTRAAAFRNLLERARHLAKELCDV